MNLDEVLQTFIAESRELLEDMESALLRIEQSPNDDDIINAIFRAAHTIKGSAGLFGLDYFVSFTHVAESVLDRVRSAELIVDSNLVALLLRSCDHISALVDHLTAGGDQPSAALQGLSAAIIDELSAYLPSADKAASHKSSKKKDGVKQAVDEANMTSLPADISVEHAQTYTKEGGGEVETDHWHISLSFGPDVMRNGMDPLSFIRFLTTLGTIDHMITVLDRIPSAENMDAESCYLGFEINFVSDADKVAIEAVFDFVRDDCLVQIVPPHSKVSEYLDLIDAMQEENVRIGDILVRCGTLTPRELKLALKVQLADDREDAPLIGNILVENNIVKPEVMAAALAKQTQSRENKGGEGSFIRVDVDKLDQLINLVGELIIAGAGASLIAKRVGLPEMLESTSTLSGLVEQVRDSALDLRMVQIGATFNRFQRVVRDVSKELGKDIDLVISGADTELDKTVVEKIGDPLTHLVRNSMDHGIESAEVRLANGKPAKGTLKLNAFHDSGSIVIEVSDDGGGLNKERILKKATERGLVSEGQNLTDKEIYNLIFEAGFSTAEAVSSLSGRGVGMDVVRRNITALRGTVDLQSTPGQGSTVRIRLPLTLAIIDGFLIGVGDASYVVPLDMVVECVELNALKQDEAGNKHYLNLRGEVLPYMRLREHFKMDESKVGRENVVVVRYGENKVGLVVDKLMGEFQTVIKPLGKMFSQIKGVGGFTILGSGEVALILDVIGLMKQVVGAEMRQFTQNEVKRPALTKTLMEPLS